MSDREIDIEGLAREMARRYEADRERNVGKELVRKAIREQRRFRRPSSPIRPECHSSRSSCGTG